MSEINIFYLLSAMVFGLIHSLEPGHGKGLITTFVLSTNKVKRREIFLIGLLATITHTTVIFIFAFLGFKVIGLIAPGNNEIFARILASVVILSIGFWLLWDRVFHHLIHAHHHGHDDCCIHDKITKKVEATSVLAIGILSGIVPCSGGLAIVMAAVATGEFESLLKSFLYIFSFSAGLGITLILVAFSVSYGKDMLNSYLGKSINNLEKCSSALSAILIYSLGLILLVFNVTPFINEKLEGFHLHDHGHEHHEHHKH